jgi:hypothetical protein
MQTICKTQPFIPNPHQIAVVPSRKDGLCGRIMRVSMFQMAAAYDGWLERLAFKWRWNQLHQVKCCSEQGRYNPARCRDSDRILSELGGEKFSVIPRDKEARINGIYFDPTVIKKKIAALGGSWEKIEHDGKSHFAIRPPKVKNQEWKKNADKVLLQMYWKPASWDKDLIITAEDVGNALPLGENNKCVLIIDVTVPAPMQRREIGKFIGLGCHVAISNARGIVIDPKEIEPQTGVITEAACYEDLGCVMEFLHTEKGIAKSQVILRGNCLNAAIAVQLVAKYAKNGINAFLDNVPLSPREILEGYPKLLKFYDSYIGATKSLPASPLRQLGIRENGFDAMATIQDMPVFPACASKVLFVGTKGDIATPPEKVKRVYHQLSRKLPFNCKYFCQDLSQIPNGENLNAHMASSIRNPQVQEIFLKHFGLCSSNQT